MRRPDAKLADAVVDRRTSVETQAAPSTLVKRDADGEVAWKPVSAVSGQAGEEEAEVGSPLRQKVDRRDQESKTSPATGPPEEQSTVSKAISALINETGTAKRKATTSQSSTKPASEPTTTKSQDQQPPSNDTIAIKQEPKDDKLAIFDFTDSSPIDTTKNPRPRIPDTAKTSRTARRHSAMPATTDRENSSKPEKEKEKPEGALLSVHKRTGSGNLKSSSSSSSSTNLSRSISHGSATLSSANFAKSTSSSARISSTAVSKEKDKKGAAVAGGSSSDARAKEDAKDRETSSLRAERAASRRKSMML
jgi:hypothetical protein